MNVVKRCLRNAFSCASPVLSTSSITTGTRARAYLRVVWTALYSSQNSAAARCVVFRKPRLHDTTGCPTRLSNWFDNRLNNRSYHVNGVGELRPHCVACELALRQCTDARARYTCIGLLIDFVSVIQLCRILQSAPCSLHCICVE